MKINRFEPFLEDEYPCRQRTNGVATLLIPNVLNIFLEERLIERGCTLSIYLRNLVQKYRGHLMTQHARSARAKCQRLYQSPGLDLCRRNFRPESSSWTELGIFAAYMGVSKCYLFVLLLQFEIASNDENEGLPTDRVQRYDILFPGRIEFSETIHRRKGIATRKIATVAVPPWQLRQDLWPYPPPEEWIRQKLREVDY